LCRGSSSPSPALGSAAAPPHHLPRCLVVVDRRRRDVATARKATGGADAGGTGGGPVVSLRTAADLSDALRDADHVLYFDGGSRGNPGPGGCGAVLEAGGVVRCSAAFSLDLTSSASDDPSCEANHRD